jgi:hypothetical protein
MPNQHPTSADADRCRPAWLVARGFREGYHEVETIRKFHTVPGSYVISRLPTLHILLSFITS